MSEKGKSDAKIIYERMLANEKEAKERLRASFYKLANGLIDSLCNIDLEKKHHGAKK